LKISICYLKKERFFLFEEIEGGNIGSFLSWNPENPWWINFLLRFYLIVLLPGGTEKSFLHLLIKEKEGKE